VFVQSSEPGGLALHAFDAASGSPLYAATTPWPTGFNPARYPVAPWGGTLHAADLGGGAVVTYDAATGAAGWSASLRGSFDPSFSNWAPAVTDTQVFTNVNGRFRAARRSDGAELFSLPVAGPTSGSLQTLHELSQAPVVVDADSVLLLDQRRADGSATANQLTMIDLPTRQVRWTANGHFTAHPVAAGGIVVAGNQQSELVEVRSATSGAILWTWAPGHADDETIDSLLLTDNLLFVSAGRRTHAIDLQTRQSVWSYPLAGQLALSPAGLLYIRAADALAGDRLVAINVR
jgi:outer membrane protein assembly factor BamB